MPGQKGSLLDKIKAFFIRRKNNKIKKKEQQKKELEQILKNISEKVEPIGMVVKVGIAVDKINLNKVVLTTPNKSVQVSHKKSNSINIKTNELQEVNINQDKNIREKMPTEQELVEETINTMDSNNLHKLREILVAQVPTNKSISKKGIPEDSVVQGKDISHANEDSMIQKNQNDKIPITDKHVLNKSEISDDKAIQKESVTENISSLTNNTLTQEKINIDKRDKKTFNKKETLTIDNVQKSFGVSASDGFQNFKKEKGNVKDNVPEIVVNKSVAKKIKFIKNSKVKSKTPKMFNFKIRASKRENIKTKEEEVSLILIRMIDRNLSELSYFKEELDYLTDKNKNAKTKEEIFEVEQRFLILKERLEKVYNDFLLYRDSDILQNINELSYNEELVELITKYKLDIIDNESIEQILKNIESNYKENLNIIENIVCLEKSKEVLGDEIYKNKEDIRIRDEEIEATEEVVNKINFMKEELDNNLSSNKEIINSVIDKINSIHPEERVHYQFNIVNNFAISALNFAFATSMLNPRNGRLANALGAVCMLNSVRSLGRIFRPEREVYYVSSNDFENEIIEHLNDFTYINKNIDFSIEEIDKIKLEFDDKYLEYIDDIPEIKETYTKINELQEQLKDIKIEMKHQERKLEQSRELNNQIVKRIENN